MNGKDWATLILAIVGALTGISSLAWNVATYLLRDRPRLALNYAMSLPINAPALGEEWMVSITAVNRTKHMVVVESVGCALSDRTKLLFPPNPYRQLPHQVIPGEKYEAFLDVVALAQALRRQGPDVRIVGVWANDAVGNTWRRRVRRSWATNIRNWGTH